MELQVGVKILLKNMDKYFKEVLARFDLK